ncbi:MAG TPA: MASE1 domain-containing protein, partial [Gammaproteobacteria bacterium]|nr:MASE1 domain-containing protein [Gammaproteobacteria bacterium]
SSDIVRFIFLIGLISTLLSATNGVLSLAIGQMIPWENYWNSWITWWLGDTMGVIIVTPLVFILWQRKLFFRTTSKWIESILLLVAVGTIGILAFGGWYPVEYLLIPCVLWAAFRFAQPGAVITAIIISIIAITGTIHDGGSFVTGSRSESLFLLQIFIGVITITSLLLSAALAERNQRTLDLIKSTHEAETANRAKTIFLANMSHELRTPLNHIIGYSELIKEELTENNQLALIPDIEKICQSSQQLLKIIADVLDYAKLEAGNIEFEITEFDLPSFVEKLKKAVQPLAEKNNNKLEFHFQSTRRTIRLDQQKIYRVLYSLLENACKFTSNGNITCTIQDTNKNEIIFEIKDTGIGLTEKQMETLFRPFVKVENAAFSGIGLGLAISHSLCRLMNGSLTVESRTQQGATFTVRLPIR